MKGQVDEHRVQAVRGITEAQRALMEHGSVDLDREFKLIEKTDGADHLDLVLATGHVSRLLGNVRVVPIMNPIGFVSCGAPADQRVGHLSRP
jgi:hypothetical protein